MAQGISVRRAEFSVTILTVYLNKRNFRRNTGGWYAHGRRGYPGEWPAQVI